MLPAPCVVRFPLDKYMLSNYHKNIGFSDLFADAAIAMVACSRLIVK